MAFQPKIQAVLEQIRKTIRPFGLALLIALGAGAVKAPAEGVKLTVDQARTMAYHAINQQRPKLAYHLAEGVLEVHPRDGAAHYTQALAFSQVGAYGFGRKSARKAYNNAQTPVQRYEAAHLASQLAFKEDKLTLSQFWLRRAVHHAPSEEVRQDSIQAFKNVRARNPLHFSLQFSVTPSDNVNNGANSPVNIIDGVPVAGVLSPSAQAVDGVVATTDLKARYRISYTDRSVTHVTGRAYARRVEFNNAVAGLSGSDVSSSRLEIGLQHALIDGSRRGQWQFNVTGGRVWSGGSPLYDFARFGVERDQRLTDNLLLSVGTSVERQQDETFPFNDATQYQVFAHLSYRLSGGGRLGAFASFRDTETSGFNRASEQITGVLSYTMGRELGPARLSFQVGQSYVDYDTYSLGAGLGAVPGGRRDDSTFGGVTAAFQDWSYLGFVPTVSVQTEQSRSNISRFDVDETSVSFGIRSEF